MFFQNNEFFIDDSFPPLPKSLYYNPEEPRDESVDQWLRPTEITCDPYEEQIKWAVFRTPMPSDISQGKIIYFTLLLYLENIKLFRNCV